MHLCLFQDRQMPAVTADSARAPSIRLDTRRQGMDCKTPSQIIETGGIAAFPEKLGTEAHPVNDITRFGNGVKMISPICENVIESDTEQCVEFRLFQNLAETDCRFQQFPFAGHAVEFENSLETGHHLISLCPFCRFGIPFMYRFSAQGIHNQIRQRPSGRLQSATISFANARNFSFPSARKSRTIGFRMDPEGIPANVPVAPIRSHLHEEIQSDDLPDVPPPEGSPPPSEGTTLQADPRACICGTRYSSSSRMAIRAELLSVPDPPEHIHRIPIGPEIA